MSDKIKNAPPMAKKGNIGRVIKKLVGYYPVLAPLTALCILFSAIVSSIPSIFMQNVLSIVEKYYKLGDWSTAKAEIMPWVTALIVLYVLSILSMTLYSQLMAYMTQGFLNKLRREMFDGMQDLPIKYFDTHQHGDIMSYYTNDIDTLRQLVSQAIPSFIQAGAIVLCVLAIMLYYSILMTLVLLLGVVAMIFVAKKVGGGSARFFLRQQKSVAKTEGYIQEMMNGQKVVKVFCHEDACLAGFDEINDALCDDSFRANAYANILGPIIGNIGNVLYVTLALVGGVFLLANIPNVSISGAAFSVSILVPFLNMSKQFTGNVNQLSQQINAIVMAGAGAERIFTLIGEKPEADNGYVTLVNANIAPDGTITESAERTGHWAWRHPHSNGSLTYTELRGDVRMVDVDFGYEEGKEVLHDVSVYAEPGQKVAFVGATGAGKTTIFDAITYALYDAPSGTNRDTSMFRSKYASPETPTFVEMTFSCGGKVYTVKRNPEYERPARRGSKMTKQRAEAELHLPDGRGVLDKPKEVNAELTQIIGLDRSQFSQIAMIAQGEFLKLLTAETKDRQEIFRKIFKTNCYEVLQNRLKDSANTLYRKCEAARASVQQYIGGIVCAEGDMLREKVQQAKEGKLPFAETVELLETLIDRDEAEDAACARQFEVLEEKIGAVNARLIKADERRKMREALEKNRKQQEVQRGEAEQAKAALAAEQAKQPQQEARQRALADLENELPRYAELENAEKERLSLASDIETKRRALVQQERTHQAQSAELAAWKQEHESLASAAADRERLLGERSRRLDRKTALKALAEDVEAQRRGEQEIADAENQLAVRKQRQEALASELAAQTKTLKADREAWEQGAGLDAEREKLRAHQAKTQEREAELRTLNALLRECRTAEQTVLASQQAYLRAQNAAEQTDAAYSESRQPQVLPSFAGQYRLACTGVDALVMLHGVQLLAVLVVYPPDMSKL